MLKKRLKFSRVFLEKRDFCVELNRVNLIPAAGYLNQIVHSLVAIDI